MSHKILQIYFYEYLGKIFNDLIKEISYKIKIYYLQRKSKFHKITHSKYIEDFKTKFQKHTNGIKINLNIKNDCLINSVK